MAFDKERVLAEINTTLQDTPLPNSPGNPVSAGYVNRIIANAGQVHLVLDLPPDVGPAGAEIKRTIEARLIEIDGVDSVQILERTKPAAEAGPTPAAGGGPVFGAQGVPGVKHIVAVASGKGGVGKSTIAVNLAAALARAGQRTGLMDSDVYGPSIPKMLGLEGHRPAVTDQERIVPIEKHGLKTISIGFLLDDESPVVWRGPMVTGLLKQFLFQVEWGELDYLVLDLPPGTGDAQLTLVQSVALAGGIIVTTPQDVALLDVQRGIQMFQRVEVPILGIVENMSTFVCPHCRNESAIFSTGGGEAAAERYGVPFLGSVPLVPDYARHGDAGTPTAVEDPEAPLSVTIAGMAQSVIETLG